MKKLLVVIPLILLVTACGRGTTYTTESAPTSVVAKHEDCTVFLTRTTDGSYVHWVRCQKQAVTETQHTESCGKGCTRHVRITTVDESGK